jgi:drug/metabolite transporter (DMT)-like permease
LIDVPNYSVAVVISICYWEITGAPFLRLPPPGQWLRLVAVCLFIGVLHFTALFIALGRSDDVSSLVIIQQTYIPIAVVLAMVMRKAT